MKRSFFLLMLTAVAFASCADDNPIKGNGGGNGDGDLVTPDIDIAIGTQGPMTGTLEVFPCLPATSTYYGNYFNGKLSPFPGMYVLADGAVSGTPIRPILLPVGTYNMLYWGTTQTGEMITNNPNLGGPQLTLGGDLSQQYFSLVQDSPDTTYRPVPDLVYAVVPTDIGTDKLSAVLRRQTAGFQAIVKSSSGATLASAIDSMSVRIGGIAEGLNVYTAAPVNQTRTVAIPLVLSADSLQMSNPVAMLFPSAVSPLFQLIVTLKNGTVKTFSQALSNPLKANTMLTLTITIGGIFSEEETGSFTVDSWETESEDIDIPSLE
ncbi:FimB/Mfa2 family fimbrial subunit [Bacteroides timonensis]|uniref:FimB/Mfa2 family fimbrial subunit n=1 Tax=Bacteroides timonensis TaxID=1470345 RepID=UPI0004B46531|nr:FimB/Mfa2 family fimbrial subunit [Bacteroides timonensis]